MPLYHSHYAIVIIEMKGSDFTPTLPWPDTQIYLQMVFIILKIILPPPIKKTAVSWLTKSDVPPDGSSSSLLGYRSRSDPRSLSNQKYYLYFKNIDVHLTRYFTWERGIGYYILRAAIFKYGRSELK